jgi:hypothetical protein
VAYLKINGHDYSQYVNKLTVIKDHNYTSRITSSGYMKIKYIAAKRTLEVGIIPLDQEAMQALLKDINGFEVSVEYRNPETGALETIPECIIASNTVDYYTIRADKTSYQAFNFKIQER